MKKLQLINFTGSQFITNASRISNCGRRISTSCWELSMSNENSSNMTVEVSCYLPWTPVATHQLAITVAILHQKALAKRMVMSWVCMCCQTNADDTFVYRHNCRVARLGVRRVIRLGVCRVIWFCVRRVIRLGVRQGARLGIRRVIRSGIRVGLHRAERSGILGVILLNKCFANLVKYTRQHWAYVWVIMLMELIESNICNRLSHRKW